MGIGHLAFGIPYCITITWILLSFCLQPWLPAKFHDLCFSEELKELYKQVTGNVLVASGIVAYFGPFTVQYRDNLLKDWCEKCQEENIRVSDDVTLNSVLGWLITYLLVS